MTKMQHSGVGLFSFMITQPEIADPLFSATSSLPCRRETRFAASEHFLTERPSARGVRFSEFGPNFREHFLTRVEQDVPAAHVHAHRLRRSSSDQEIGARLGKGREIRLCHLFRVLERQPNGETDGLACVANRATVCYIRAADGRLWTVRALWSVFRGFEGVNLDDPSIRQGWYLEAALSDGPHAFWGLGGHVLSL